MLIGCSLGYEWRSAYDYSSIFLVQVPSIQLRLSTVAKVRLECKLSLGSPHLCGIHTVHVNPQGSLPRSFNLARALFSMRPSLFPLLPVHAVTPWRRHLSEQTDAHSQKRERRRTGGNKHYTECQNPTYYLDMHVNRILKLFHMCVENICPVGRVRRGVEV